MSFESIMNDIAIIREKDIPMPLYEKIKVLHDKYGTKTFQRASKELMMMDRIPNNIYGVLARLLDDMQSADHDRLSKGPPKLPPRDECATPEEIHAARIILNETFKKMQKNFI